jgi:hypothetical protein
MRDAVNAARQAAGTAATTAGAYGAQAGGIGANLVPQLTRQMQNPQGYSQRDVGAQLTSALAGAGGATAGLSGAAGKMAVDTRNPMGFSSALDAAAMQRDKAAAGVGERVAANNADVKLRQQEQAQQALSGLYGTNVRAQTENAAQQAPDINAQVNADKQGWLQNAEGIVDTATGVFGKMFPKGIGGK